MKIVVSGAAGFIAPHIIEKALSLNWEVIGIDLNEIPYNFGNNFKFLKKDIREIDENDLSNVNFFYHLAFVTNIPNSIKNPIDTTYDNIDMTVKTLDLCQKSKIDKFFFPSTASLYGNNITPWREDMQPDPIEPYSFQKLSCEYACQMWNKCYGLKTTIFRYFQVFGENQRADTVIAKFLKSKKENKPITLVQTTAQSSFKTARRDFIYVKDIADAMIEAAISKKTGYGEVLNIGSGKLTAIEEVANTIGGKVEFIPQRKFEVEEHLADMSKTFEYLNWKPKTNVISWLNNFVRELK